MFISQTINNHKYQSVSLTGDIYAKNSNCFYNRFHCSSCLKQYDSYSRVKDNFVKSLSTLGEFFISYSRSGKLQDSQMFLIL